MSRTPVPTLTAGQFVTDEAWNAVAAAAAELQEDLPETSTVWENPITSGITVGNGQVYAHYAKIGPLVACQFRFVQGTTGGVTGDIFLAPPIPIKGGAHSTLFGVGWATSSRYVLHVGVLAGGQILVRLMPTSAAYSTVGGPMNSTIPLTWVSGQYLGVSFWYFAA